MGWDQASASCRTVGGYKGERKKEPGIIANSALPSERAMMK
jgi:hypothetical protein